MLDQRFVEHAAIRQEASHHETVHDTMHTIGESDGPGLRHQAKLSHSRALKFFRCSTVKIEPCTADPHGPERKRVNHTGIIDHRLGVGKRYDAGDPAGNSSVKKGCQIFQMFIPWVCTLHSHVDDARRKTCAGTVNH